MTDDMTVLGKRAVACRGWRWMPGMLVGCAGWSPVRMVSVEADASAVDESGQAWFIDGDALPDLDDPTTAECLIALVREAWGPDLRVFRDGSWFVEFAPSKVPEDMYGQRTFTAHTLVDALVDALEAAP